MSDLRSFLRYLFPGIVLVAEFALLLFAAGGYQDLVRFTAWANDAGLGGSTVLLGGVAGLGVLLATIHHTLYWVCDRYRAADLSTSVVALHEEGKLAKLLPGNSIGCAQDLRDPRTAWQIFTALWHLHRKSSISLDSATNRVESMTDLMHSAGTALIASAMAAVLTVPYLAQTRTGLDLHIAVLVVLPVSLLLLAIHWRSYRTLGLHLQGVANAILVAALWESAPTAGALNRLDIASSISAAPPES